MAMVASAPAMVTVIAPLAAATLPPPDHGVSLAVTSCALLGVLGSVTSSV
jgi:hypothetical protein